jgi:hypothetical protein
MTSRSLLFVLLLLGAGSVRADAPPPSAEVRSKPSDYAMGLTLDVQPDLAVQTFLLPREVYRGARADLSDLAVFNREGEPLAWALRKVPRAKELHRTTRNVPLFPLRGPSDLPASGMALHLERSSDGAVVGVRMKGAGDEPKDDKLLAYVLHTGAPDHDITALRFELGEASGSALSHVRIEASDDLSHWRLLRADQAIGRLEHAGHQISLTRLAEIRTRAPFLRISWSGELPFAITKVDVEHEELSAEPELETPLITLGPVPLVDGSYRLDLGGSFPLRSLTPHFAGKDVLFAATLSVGDEWPPARQVFGGQLYQLSHEGADLRSDAIALVEARVSAREQNIEARVSAREQNVELRARYLRLKPLAEASAPREPVRFAVAYAPEQLLFVPRGQGPYLLAYGSHHLHPAPFDAERLTAFLSSEQRARLPLASAHGLSVRTLGGEAARTAPKAPLPMRTWLLWAVLVAGAALLIGLSLRLLRKTGGA